MEDSPQHLLPRERLTQAVQRCANGLSAEAASDFDLDRTPSGMIAERQWHAPICVRFVFVPEPLDQSIGAELLDETGAVLAASTGTRVLLVPNRGVLCLPEEAQLRVRVNATQRPVHGLFAAMTSP